MKMIEPRTHIDCRNFAPVDVAKGVCHRTKALVLADADACDAFEQTPKCRSCGSYEARDTPFLGTCTAAASRPVTYPDLLAVTCAHYSRRQP